MNEQAHQMQLELRDIHLPDPISWWPPAPGWWLLLTLLILIIVTTYIAKVIYKRRQLGRDIRFELEQIKQHYEQTKSKSQLAKTLSVLLRRTSITCNPHSDIAGLTGKDWLCWLDNNIDTSTTELKFCSETGNILINAPYLPDDSKLDFNANDLIRLCESWLLKSHQKKPQKTLLKQS